ncbi:hypothetical protein H6G76_31970 [Nostoc sp. FACHB-152]|nr:MULTISPECIES: hypothetical protein [unclassified Nostoc]MBD2451655.1 hypothetical protein [Nostoc sp. FACHB-152]MBD2472761.1 hypothetical protein [Nostoc sp. FACHB-145]
MTKSGTQTAIAFDKIWISKVRLLLTKLALKLRSLLTKSGYQRCDRF